MVRRSCRVPMWLPRGLQPRGRCTPRPSPMQPERLPKVRPELWECQLAQCSPPECCVFCRTQGIAQRQCTPGAPSPFLVLGIAPRGRKLSACTRYRVTGRVGRVVGRRGRDVLAGCGSAAAAGGRGPRRLCFRVPAAAGRGGPSAGAHAPRGRAPAVRRRAAARPVERRQCGAAITAGEGPPSGWGAAGSPSGRWVGCPVPSRDVRTRQCSASARCEFSSSVRALPVTLLGRHPASIHLCAAVLENCCAGGTSLLRERASWCSYPRVRLLGP